MSTPSIELDNTTMDKKENVDAQVVTFLPLDTAGLLKKDGTLGTLLAACHIMRGGFGDLDHYIKFCKKGIENANQTKHFKIAGLVTCPKSFYEEAVIRLKEYGLEKTTVVPYPDDDEENTRKYLEAHYLSKSNEKFKTQMDDVVLAYNISSPHMLELLPVILKRKETECPVKIITIREHGASVAYMLNDTKVPYEHAAINTLEHRNMGAGFNDIGYYLTQTPPIELSLEDKAKKLFAIEDKKFLSMLLGNMKNVTQADCVEFLKSTHLVSGYMQEGALSFTTIMLGIAKSEINQLLKYKSVVFVVNKGNFSRDALDLRFLKLHGIQILHRNEEDRLFGYGEKDNPKIIIKIYEHWFRKRQDKKLISEVARTRVISGDTDFEDSMNDGVFLIKQPRAHKFHHLNTLCRLFQEHGAETLNKLYSCLHELGKLVIQTNNLNNGANTIKQTGDLALDLAKQFNIQALKEWKNLIKILQKDYNCTPIIPMIVDQTIDDYVVGLLNQKFPGDKRIEPLKDQIQQLDRRINHRANQKFAKLILDIQENHCGKRLNLHNINFTPWQWEMLFNALILNKEIEELDLSANEITSKHFIPELAKFLAINQSIKKLNLAANEMDAPLFNTLFQELEQNITVQVLNLSHNNFGNEGVIHLAKWLARKEATLKDLEMLSIEGMDDNAKNAIIDIFENNRSLERFYFGNKKILLKNTVKQIIQAYLNNDHNISVTALSNMLSEREDRILDELILKKECEIRKRGNQDPEIDPFAENITFENTILTIRKAISSFPATMNSQIRAVLRGAYEANKNTSALEGYTYSDFENAVMSDKEPRTAGSPADKNRVPAKSIAADNKGTAESTTVNNTSSTKAPTTNTATLDNTRITNAKAEGKVVRSASQEGGKKVREDLHLIQTPNGDSFIPVSLQPTGRAGIGNNTFESSNALEPIELSPSQLLQYLSMARTNNGSGANNLDVLITAENGSREQHRMDAAVSTKTITGNPLSLAVNATTADSSADQKKKKKKKK